MTLWNNVAELLDYYIPPMPSEYWADITVLQPPLRDVPSIRQPESSACPDVDVDVQAVHR